MADAAKKKVQEALSKMVDDEVEETVEDAAIVQKEVSYVSGNNKWKAIVNIDRNDRDYLETKIVGHSAIPEEVECSMPGSANTWMGSISELIEFLELLQDEF